MATVCGSLALMDAGVPLKAPVAGIAMGLIKEGNDFAVLSDILGDEDHLGDMDFKVKAPSRRHFLQMDIKITGITEEIMRAAAEQAREGRPPHPARDVEGAVGRARRARRVRPLRIETIKIPTDKIREVIGSGGSVIRSIVEEPMPRSTSRTTAR